MGRKVDKPYNGGQWSEARFNSFIKSTLRKATQRWGPIQQAKKDARVKRGYYLCNSCKEEVPATLPPVKAGGKRVQNIFVDHIKPIVDPTLGFVSWDIIIKRMFCEKDNLQVLCAKCHTAKTKKENELAKRRRQYENHS